MTSNVSLPLFIALQPDAGVREQIQRHAATWQWPEGTQYTPAANYHLSLVDFPTLVPPEAEPWIRAQLRKVAMVPLELTLQTPIAWPHAAVLCPEPHAGLSALRERILACLSRKTSVFNPHVTMAREVPQAVPPTTSVPIQWRVRDFSLMWFNPDTRRHVVPERYGVNAEAIAPPAASPIASPVQSSLF